MCNKSVVKRLHTQTTHPIVLEDPQSNCSQGATQKQSWRRQPYSRVPTSPKKVSEIATKLFSTSSEIPLLAATVTLNTSPPQSSPVRISHFETSLWIHAGTKQEHSSITLPAHIQPFTKKNEKGIMTIFILFQILKMNENNLHLGLNILNNLVKEQSRVAISWAARHTLNYQPRFRLIPL